MFSTDRSFEPFLNVHPDTSKPCHPRPHRHPKNGGHSHQYYHHEAAAATAATAATGPRKIRVVSSSTDSCRSYASTPTAYSYSPQAHSVGSPNSLLGCGLNNNVSPSKKMPQSVENEEESMHSLLAKFSTLEAEIKSLLKGKNSLKDRIQSLGTKQESTKSVIQCLEDSQEGIKGRLDVMEQQAIDRVEYLKQLKKERTQSLAQANSNNSESMEPVATHGLTPEHKTRKPVDQSQNSNNTEEEEEVKVQPRELRRIIKCWDENNCDLHLRRLIYSSRQIAAYEILEFAHKRLSTHLINHISETARDLIGEEKSGYLALFIKYGPFESNPVGEGTYAELLKFVQREHKPKKELLKALKAAEDSLVEEAAAAGYRAYDIGDIRSQMTGFFTTAMQNCSRYCHPIPLADTEVTKEIIEDTQKAAEEGKLGVLQKASKLIKLGCYFLRWQLVAEDQEC